MSRDPDIAIGSIAAAGGSAGMTMHLLADTLSLAVLSVNLIVALGGAYLLWLRIRKARKEIDGD
jgi:ABC-type enterobactin transport system permease subunit